jgi:hypothetical protein
MEEFDNKTTLEAIEYENYLAYVLIVKSPKSLIDFFARVERLMVERI